MGTRGLLGFVVDGRELMTYNHFDSYPGGLGEQVLNFLRQLVKDGAVDQAAARARELKLVTDETPVTAADIEALKDWTDLGVGGLREGQTPEWYNLLRRTQGDPDAILSSGYLVDNREFARNSLFCEWAYVIDFDDRTLEVYRGFQTKPPTAGRWAGTAPDSDVVEQQTARLGNGYYPIEQVVVFGFDALPDAETFTAHLNALAGYDDE